MDTIRLEIDGTISQICASDASSYPHFEVPSVSASVSSIHSDESPMTKPSKKRRENEMSLRQYSFLCWKIFVVLLLEIGILLSVLVTYNCKFYQVNVAGSGNQEQSRVLYVGLYRYSLGGSDLPESHCTRFSSTIANMDTILGQWLNSATFMLAVPRMLAVSAPMLAALGCISIVLQVFQPGRFCGRLSISAILFLAGLFQTLSAISFDGNSMCNLFGILPSSSVKDCQYSAGFRMSVVASSLYFAVSILASTVPQNDGKPSEQRAKIAKKAKKTGKTKQDANGKGLFYRQEEDPKQVLYPLHNLDAISECHSDTHHNDTLVESEDEIVFEATPSVSSHVDTEMPHFSAIEDNQESQQQEFSQETLADDGSDEISRHRTTNKQSHFESHSNVQRIFEKYLGADGR